MSEPTCIDCGTDVRPDNLGSLRSSPWGSVAICARCRAKYEHDVYLDLRMDEALAAARGPRERRQP